MKIILRLKIVVLLVIFSVLVSNAQKGREYTDEEAKKVEVLFEAGNDLMENQKFAEALAKYKEGLAIIPEVQGLLYNGGLAAFSINDFEQALSMWKKLKELEPEDWQLRAKLIQTYQSLGKNTERDSERKELFDLRKSGKIAELNKAEYYVREQTTFGGRKMMIFEHFELKGPRGLRYVFYILNNEGKPEYRISLGSYDTTNNIWRETTKPTPKEGERLFHLDGYFANGGHATYGMYPKEPTYDETREIVKKILEKEKKPVSSSAPVQ